MKFSILFSLLTFATVGNSSLVYTPQNFDARTARLVVVIHGCLQSSESMAFGSGWNQIAEANNLAVLYPQVPKATNPLDCWTWFTPENQREDSGQLKIVFDEIQEVKAKLNLKNPITFVAGISSGGATVSGLMACFPKEFAAGAVHSGMSYGLAQNLKDGIAVMKDGPPETAPSARCKPTDHAGAVMTIYGTADDKVNVKNGPRIIQDFIGTLTPVSIKQLFEGNIAYQINDYVSANGNRGRLVSVRGLGHAWFGLDLNRRHKLPTQVPFFTNEGPSATNLMWEFFQQNSRSPANKK